MAHITAPFDRQPNESEEAYYAFTLYRDLGRDRSLDKVAERLRTERRGLNAVMHVQLPGEHHSSTEAGPDRHRKSGQLGKWSVQHGWVERARAWDSLLDERLRANQLDAIERMASRQAQHFELAQMVAMRPLVEIAQALQDPNRAIQLGTASLIDLYELAAKFVGKMPRLAESERFARGVRVTDIRDGSPQGGTAEWRVVVHQPPRAEPLPADWDSLEPAEPEEWEGDRPNTDDDD